MFGRVFRDDKKRNGKKCGMKVACIYFVDELKAVVHL